MVYVFVDIVLADEAKKGVNAELEILREALKPKGFEWVGMTESIQCNCCNIYFIESRSKWRLINREVSTTLLSKFNFW